MWLQSADLLRPLWTGAAPAALYQGSCERLVDSVLSTLRSEGKLLILDDLDPCFTSGAAGVPDAELRLLLAALEAGELADSGAAVLITAHHGPAGLSVPVRPLPPLTPSQATAIAGRSVTQLAPIWLRRPGALALLRALPERFRLPSDRSQLWGTLLTALLETLPAEDEETLLILALARQPTPAAAVAASGSLHINAATGSLQRLEGKGLIEAVGCYWRCARSIGSASRRLIPERQILLQKNALLQRLAGYFLRELNPSVPNRTELEDNSSARLGLRYAVAAGDGRMALQGALHGGTLRAAQQLSAWRPIRDDLTLALSVPAEHVEQSDLASACLLLAEAASHIGDHTTAAPALLRALPHAQACGDRQMAREIHTRLARHHILNGSGRQSLEHLRAALREAERTENRAASSDLLGMCGSVHLQAGRLSKAQQNFEAALTKALTLDDTRRAASRRAGLGGVLMYRGQLRDAETQLQLAAEEARSCGDRRGLTSRLLNVSLVRLLRGDIRGAMACIAEAAAELPPEEPRIQARLLSLRGDLRMRAGDLSGAARDLDDSLEAASLSGDRDALIEIWATQGRWRLCKGDYEAARTLFNQATEELSNERPDADSAAREAEGWHARAWQAASQFFDQEASALQAILEAEEQLAICCARIPAEPFRVRHLSCVALRIEVQLLSASLNRVAPLAQLYRLEELLEEHQQDPEFANTGAPELRVLKGWALQLCGRCTEATTAAERAELDAGMNGLAATAAMARALQGKELPEWHGPARLLSRLLAFASSAPPPHADRETGAIPLHGPRGR
ncbi:MAG: hypothetical protein CMP23_03105 [Rickettsiales bacterium]|nr:hypothetical protein [Rickettsiales bacterium]|tara:strand:- start:2329 stop:4728 length:2400 start_codon:yes stop_codon:yes gene_type:complete